MILLTGYQTPAALRRIGTARLEAWLRNRHARKASSVEATAVTAVNTQHTRVPGEQLAADLVTRLAQEVIDLDATLKEIDATIEDRFHRHRYAEIIVSLPGFGPRLGAELLTARGGDIALYDSADRLAGLAGLAPVPRDSGRVSGNLHRPRRFNRRLLRASYLAAQLSIRHDPASKHYYDRQAYYVWLRRFEAEGVDGLPERSRWPNTSPNATHADVLGKIVHLRQTYHFRPGKIQMYLARYHDVQISKSGVWRIFKRLDMNRLPASQRYKRHDRWWKRYDKQRPGQPCVG